MRRHSWATALFQIGAIWLAQGTLAVSATTTDAALRAAVVAGNYTSRISPETRRRCPRSCSSSGVDPNDWYMYHSVNRLDACDSTMLLHFTLYNDLDNPENHISIAACTADLEASDETASTLTNTTSACPGPVVSQAQVTSSLQLASSGSSSSTSVSSVVEALDQLQAYLSMVSEASCDEIIEFAYSGEVAVGVYVGSALAKQEIITSVLEQLSNQVQTSGIAESTLVQLCDDRPARYSLGIFVDTNADLAFVQRGVQSWRDGTCISSMDETAAWQNITYSVPSTLDSNSTKVLTRNHQLLTGRDDTCTTIEVVSGDTCATLVEECGITTTEFYEYNTASDLCSTLAVGQDICCSSGDLPDNTPSEDSDGYCYSYTIVSGDTCSSIAASYDITVDDITNYNNDTWGWNGCSDLVIGNYICLSTGYPPMPATLANAVCGPQVSGTAAVAAGADMSTLNECPLNACCDIWGQCGVTSEYCTESNSTTGAPGTAAEGENGCISNCGTSIVTSDASDEVYSIAYFEAYDQERDCLTMTVDKVPSSYTHIHFSFATINTDYSINTSMIDDQLSTFQALTGDVKKIVSIGGWDFSTGASTYSIFRDVVSTNSSRQTLITNVINFLDEYDLDGVDWDWEYPDEPDIPDIPAGTEEDSTGYFELMDELKASMPSGKTVSVTAPASYWYLQYFPIVAISEVVDYIVYMTYDFHGQWDYDNEYSDSGCAAGNCLRSHVNFTETLTALSMITKAGVPSNMIVVGVSSYGRSFEMTTAGCWQENCTYTGPDSGALAGICTDTAGILADYEIDLIAYENPSAEIHWDETSYSNIMVYNDTQWVAWMNSTNKAWRKDYYVGLTFLGSSDWAVDYQSEDGTSALGSDLTGDQINDYPCTTTYANTAIVGFASSTITGDSTICTGKSSTLQAGKSLTVQMASDMTVAVGTMTGADLFTSVSSALMAGCTIETEGVTVTECSDIPEITGITYFDDLTQSEDKTAWFNFDDPKTGGKLKIESVLMSVYNETVLEALITAIAAALNGTSLDPNNTISVEYECNTCYDTTVGWPTVNYTSVSSLVQAIYTEQTDDTNGAETLQNLEVSITIESDSGDFLCAAGAFVFDALGVLALLVPGFEWIEPATIELAADGVGDMSAWAAGAMSFACLTSETIGE